MGASVLLLSLFLLCVAQRSLQVSVDPAKYEGKVIKGNRNALFLVKDGKRSTFPDFYTFTHMGFNMSVISKIPDDVLNAIPLGDVIKPIAVYRPEDFMYHRLCSDPDRLVSVSVLYTMYYFELSWQIASVDVK